ncbi:MAG: nuclear transport factor 2 family protein [Gammaproteobacteria bacterium]|nr:nuclear transport factor 2 family protein [Gammaproteobacteria bacterium]
MTSAAASPGERHGHRTVAGLIGILAMLVFALPAAVLAGEAENSIEQRLQRVEDELAIRRVLVEYAATQDARDYAGYANLFAEQGEWINGSNVHKGRAAIHKMLVDLYGAPPPGFVNNESYHISSNAQIDIDGDRAKVRSRHLLVMRGPKGEPVPALAGRYEDEFIREHGEWKILRRVDYPVMPTADEWMKYIRERRAAQ